eukprot:4993809-Prymnesium_polylepis.2
MATRKLTACILSGATGVKAWQASSRASHRMIAARIRKMRLTEDDLEEFLVRGGYRNTGWCNHPVFLEASKVFLADFSLLKLDSWSRSWTGMADGR